MDNVNIPDESTMQIQRSMRCAACWEPVTITFNKDKERTCNVRCTTPGCVTPGLVHQKYVERCQAENRAIYITALSILKNAVDWLKPAMLSAAERKLRQAQTLKELGF